MSEQYGSGATSSDLRPATRAALRRATQRVGAPTDSPDLRLRRLAESRMIGLRINRYSWWTHGRELADYILPRRYKWLITPNQQQRGSPINQHILDSTGTLAARNLAAGLMTGCTDPTKRWFRLKINHLDSTQTSPISLWLAECERLLALIFQESNFYTAMATFYFDLVIFGTAVMLIYEDFSDVICCYNPCAGEYYIDNNGKLAPVVFAREFTYTISQLANEFGVENLSASSAAMWAQGGASLTREVVVAHSIEPNDDGRNFGIPEQFKYRECYFEWTGSASPQGGSSYTPGLLRKRGFYESPAIIGRWDLVSNDPYGRSPGMDALPDIKQLQLETRRKAQAIDKMVNPPMVADIQLKNQPASLLPGGVTYVSGMLTNARPGFAPVYTVTPQIKEMMEDLQEIKARIGETFFNNLFQTISQFETRSNVSATEIDARRAESMIMLGPVLERINHEVLGPAVERVFGIAARAGILPPAPPEIQGANINIEFVSMLEQAQSAAATAGIERIFALLGNLGAIDPAAMDNVDIDYGLDKMSSLLNNDPRLIRSPQELQAIRAQRQQQMEQQQRAAQAEQLAKGAKVLSDTQVGGGQSALQKMVG